MKLQWLKCLTLFDVVVRSVQVLQAKRVSFVCRPLRDHAAGQW